MCWAQNCWSASQLTAPTLTTPAREAATCFHLGASCWQWPHPAGHRAVLLSGGLEKRAQPAPHSTVCTVSCWRQPACAHHVSVHCRPCLQRKGLGLGQVQQLDL